MSKSPSKNESLSSRMASLEITNFIPKELTSHIKDEPGIAKTIFGHISRLHVFLSKWISLHEQGRKACNSISALKIHEFYEGYYPEELEKYTKVLVNVMDAFYNIVENVATISSQLQALAQLYGSIQPICSWSVKQFSDKVKEIHIDLIKEISLKKLVTENIAHCREECLIEMYVSAWQFNVYFNVSSTSYLFVEVELNVLT